MVLLASHLAHIRAGVVEASVLDVQTVMTTDLILIEVQVGNVVALGVWVGDKEAPVHAPGGDVPPGEGILVAEALHQTVKLHPLTSLTHCVYGRLGDADFSKLVFCGREI